MPTLEGKPLPVLDRIPAESLSVVDFCTALRDALKRRTGLAWSVTHGRGTAYGWVTVDAPPRRRTFGSDGTGPGDYTGAEDRAILAAALQKDHVHCQGVSIPSSTAHRREYLDRACGLPFEVAEQYWD